MNSSVPRGCLNPCIFCQFVAGEVTNGTRSAPCTAELQSAELHGCWYKLFFQKQLLFTAYGERVDYVPRILGNISRAKLIGQLQGVAALHTTQMAGH